MADSPLLAGLAQALGDPYAVNGIPTDLNVGPGDPTMGLEQLLQALAMSRMGLGGATAGMSGVPIDQGSMGIMNP
jgi:hypothetical protein